MSHGRVPLWASSTIRCLTRSGNGRPFTNTPPSWFTPPWPENHDKSYTLHSHSPFKRRVGRRRTTSDDERIDFTSWRTAHRCTPCRQRARVVFIVTAWTTKRGGADNYAAHVSSRPTTRDRNMFTCIVGNGYTRAATEKPAAWTHLSFSCRVRHDVRPVRENRVRDNDNGTHVRVLFIRRPARTA